MSARVRLHLRQTLTAKSLGYDEMALKPCSLPALLERSGLADDWVPPHGLRSRRTRAKRRARLFQRAMRQSNGTSDERHEGPVVVANTYEYRKLQDDGEVRVMLLLPAKSMGEPLRCTLVHQQLDRTSFEALSYVWGSTEVSQALCCDGKHLHITRNLDTALRYLRHKRHARRLWVDAVCINQIDMVEKSVQIRLMTSIYSKAERCVIWLGESDKDLKRTIRAVKALHLLASTDRIGLQPSKRLELYVYMVKTVSSVRFRLTIVRGRDSYSNSNEDFPST